MRTDVLGVGFDDLTMEEALQKALSLIDGTGRYVVTPNSEIVMLARKSPALKAALQGADIVAPDGIGVVYASQILGHALTQKVAGIELGAAVIKSLPQMNRRLFLLGGKPGVAKRAGDALKAKHPGLEICGVHDGYFTEDAPIIEMIKNSGADVVFVCLGAPKQELWMQRNKKVLPCLMMGLGGSLDVFAGDVSRAPDIFIRLGLEWLYRLLKQPSRIIRMTALPRFLCLAVWRRIKK